MRLCELLYTEPFIEANAGLGGSREVRKQVEYCNGDANTPMGNGEVKTAIPNPGK